MRKIIVAGIGTDVGKTIVSAIVVEALQADYWKPIQAGYQEETDTQFVKRLITNTTSRFFSETYLLKEPCSPHAAAALEGITIEMKQLLLPQSASTLVIEGAGGILVPINDTESIADLISWFDGEVLLVSKNYLGSINHTLLTIEELKRRNCNITGIVFNGEPNPSSEEIILKKHSFPFVAHIKHEPVLTKEVIVNYSSLFKNY